MDIHHLLFVCFLTCASTVEHLPGWITSVPLLSLSQGCRAAVGRLHWAHCSGIRLWSYRIHDGSCPSLHSGAHPAYQGVEPQACMAARDVPSVGIGAQCSAPCMPLQTPRRCIGTAPLRVLSHASRFRQRPELRGDRCVSNCRWCRGGIYSTEPPILCVESDRKEEHIQHCGQS